MRDDDAPGMPPRMTRSVLLEHTTPDEGRHLDWLIERPGVDDERRLIALRCAHDPCTRAPIDAERIADHRARYLDYEGPIGGGRGTVRRLWRRGCVLRSEQPGRFEVWFDLGVDGPLLLIAEAVDGDLWRIRPG